MRIKKFIVSALFLALLPLSAQQQQSGGQQSGGSGMKCMKKDMKKGMKKGMKKKGMQGGHGAGHLAEMNGYPGPKHVLEFIEELDLSAEQVSQLRKLRTEVTVQSLELSDQIKDLRTKLKGVFAEKKATENGVRTIVSEISELQGRLDMVHLAAHLRAKGILSDEQTAKYYNLRPPPDGKRGPGGPGTPGGRHGRR